MEESHVQDGYVSFSGLKPGHLFCPVCVSEFPPHQRESHALTTKHKRANGEVLYNKERDLKWCSICQTLGKEGVHEKNFKHLKCLDLQKCYLSYLVAPTGNNLDTRVSWRKEDAFARENVALGDHGRELFQPFVAEARELTMTGEYGSENEGCLALIKLMHWIDELGEDGCNSEIGMSICQSYQAIMAGMSAPNVCEVWVVKHKLPCARDLFERLRHADESMLMHEGFWVVEDTSFAGNIKNRNNINLKRLLWKSSSCHMKFQVQPFGASFMPSQEVDYNTNLHDFIIYSLMVERAIEDLRVRFLEPGSSSSVFREALFYHVPNMCDILYEQSLDMSAHRRTLPLGFERGASLIDGPTLHLTPRTLEIDDEECIDIYDFAPHDVEFIEKGNASIAHSIPLVDDAFGECAKLWCTRERESQSLLRIISGVTRGAVIASSFGTRTSIHVEDALLGTYNLLVLGAPKIWYVVPKHKSKEFTGFLKERKWLEHAYRKQCHIDCFSNGSKALSSQDMETYEIHRMVQYPGMTVMMVPRLLYHWTISCGFSLADSVNFYLKFNGTHDLDQLKGMWQSYVQDGLGDSTPHGSSTTANQYFEVCKGFGIM